MTSLTCTSRQARTHRPHWMQASRLTRIAGWLASPCPALGGGKAALGDLDLVGPVPEFRIGIVRGRARRLVGDQQLHHHLLRRDRARARGSSPSCRRSACACRTPPARARPRSPPCRRGNCRPAGSPAPASSTDAGCRVPWRFAHLPDGLAGAASTCLPSSSNWILVIPRLPSARIRPENT